MTNEAKFWNRIVEALWHHTRVLERVENGMLDGMPDSHYCLESEPGWMELKCPVEPVRAKTPLFGSNHKLTTTQRNWLIKYHQAGGRAWVAIETDKRVLLIAGHHADRINDLSVSELIKIASFHALRPLLPDTWDNFERTLKFMGRR